MTSAALSKELLGYASLAQPSMLVEHDVFKMPALTPEQTQQLKIKSFEQPQMMWVYAQWCGHCHQMKDAWTAASRAGVHAKWNAIDADSEAGTQLTRAEQISSFPSVFKYVKGVKQEFEGPRTHANLLAFSKG